MKIKTLLLTLLMPTALSLQAQINERYIEVTGTSETEVVPDAIHYIIEIKEYFEEEFDKKSKPEDYRTKVGIAQIEDGLRKALTRAGISSEAIRMQEVGDYSWRKQGQDFLVSKTFDVTLTNFEQIDQIVQNVDTKGINSMRIGDLENKNLQEYHQKGKVEALKAARAKATYLAEALGQKLGKVVRIVEQDNQGGIALAKANVLSTNAASFDNFRTIKLKYAMLVRFEIAD